MGQAGEILSKIQMDAEENFLPETIEKFQADPEFYREFVKKVEAEVNNSFPIVSRESLTMTSRGRLLMYNPSGPHAEPRPSLCPSKGYGIHDIHARREPGSLQGVNPRLPARVQEIDARPRLPPSSDKTQRRSPEIRDQAVRAGGHRARIGGGPESRRHCLRHGLQHIVLPTLPNRRPRREPAGEVAEGNAQGVSVMCRGRAAKLLRCVIPLFPSPFPTSPNAPPS